MVIIIALIINLVAALLLILLVIKLLDTLRAQAAPFVDIDQKILLQIATLLDIKPGDAVYDLGSGNGQVLISLCRHQPKARYVGFDIGFFPVVIAKWKVKNSGLSDKISIRQKNFLRQDLSGADRIFTYLFPDLMDKLLPKLVHELKPGTLLVSCDYAFSDKKPAKTVRLKPSSSGRCQTLYLYKF